jgi:hypothetical protein
MKVSAYLFLLCCTVAVPALAADGPVLALDLGAEPLATPAVGSCNAPLDQVLFASSGGKDGGGSSLVTCTADCGLYNDVSCTTSGTCVAVDRNCPNTPGYVTCNGNTTFCPACPPPIECQPDGSFRIVKTGNCCDCGLEERIREKCINGQWEFWSIFCGPNTGPCPWCP